MPTRSLSTPVLRWPDWAEVERSLHRWLAEEGARHSELCGVAVFGSYATGDWGVGSDLDLLAVISHTDTPFERRALAWDTTRLAVPVDLIIYTVDEWRRLRAQGGRFARALDSALWLRPLAGM